MGRRLIFDTTVLIDFERGEIQRSQFADDEIAIAAVTVAEFTVGIELADTPARARARAGVLTDVLSVISPLPYTEATAAHHGRLLAAVRRSGRPRGAHDLIIAAHAAETERIIVSRDAAATFGDLPGVRAISPD